MKWLVNQYLAPVANRLGGQAGAALVALGMAEVHESSVAAVVAWLVVTAAETVFDKRSRDHLIHRVKTYGDA